MKAANYKRKNSQHKSLGKKVSDIPLTDSKDALFTATKQGYVNLLRSTLRGCQDPAVIEMPDGAAGATMLSVAAKEGHKECVEYLVNECKANIEVKLTDGTTPVFLAAQQGHADIVELLLKKGAQPDTPKMNGSTALWISVKNGHLPTVKLLLQYKANPEVCVGDPKTTPLLVAAIKEYPEIIRLLKDSGASMEATLKLLGQDFSQMGSSLLGVTGNLIDKKKIAAGLTAAFF